MNTAPGWYPDTQMPGTRRYWDGETWTEHRAPLASVERAARVRLSAWSLFGIAGAVLLALMVAWMVYASAHANDGLNCTMDNLDRAQRGEPTVVCPE